MARAGWDPLELPDLAGRTYHVTGSNRGIGYFASEQLAAAGARVLMTGRHPNRLAAAKAAVKRQVADADVESLLLDTCNLGSVRAAAASVRTRGKLDGLLLNAGIVHPPRQRETTADGHELVLATNVLGHFALAGVLLTPLAAALGRMVWLGSLAATVSPYDLRDPELVEGYSPWRAYAQSKIATTMLGLEAGRRLQAAGFPVSSVVAHPGYSISGRTRGVAGVNQPSSAKRFVDNLQAAFAQSKEVGAHAVVRALVDPEVISGENWGPRWRLRGRPARMKTPSAARDVEAAGRLWDFCQETTGLHWPRPRRRS